MATKNAQVKAIKGLVAEAGVALAKDINAEVQQVEVIKTIDYKNMSKDEKTKLGKKEDASWQGYMIRFDKTSAGVAKVVPISAGRLLSIQQESGVTVFAEKDGEFTLVNLMMGIKDGNPFFEK